MVFLFSLYTALEIVSLFAYKSELSNLLVGIREIQVFKAIFYYNIFNLKAVQIFMTANDTNTDAIVS